MRIRSFLGCWECCAIVAGMSLDVLAQDCSEGRCAWSPSDRVVAKVAALGVAVTQLPAEAIEQIARAPVPLCSIDPSSKSATTRVARNPVRLWLRHRDRCAIRRLRN